MQPIRQEPMIIDLDDPVPRWLRYSAVAGAMLIAALLLLPWTIDVDTTGDANTTRTQPGQAQMQSTAGYAAICEPRIDFPSFAEPAISMAMPSWMRLCDWFAEPATQPVPMPTQPPGARFEVD